MAVTGHKSSDGVRSYKHTSDEQFKNVSTVLCQPDVDAECKPTVTGSTTIKENSNSIANVLPCSPLVNLSGCSSVVININK